MKRSEAIAAFQNYELQLASILDGFIETRSSIHIDRDDDSRYRQYVQEIVDLFNDLMGDNSYSKKIEAEFSAGLENFTASPSYKSVENIHSLLRAAITRMRRNRDVLRWADTYDDQELPDPVPARKADTSLPKAYWGAAKWGETAWSDGAQTAESPALHARMLARLEAIEATIDRLKNPVELMGHNNPPEPIDDILTREDVIEIKQAIEVLRSQTTTQPPQDLTEVKKSAEGLKAVGEKVAKHLDKFADEFAKSVGNEAGKRLVQAPFWIPLGLQLIDAAHMAIAWLASLGFH